MSLHWHDQQVFSIWSNWLGRIHGGRIGRTIHAANWKNSLPLKFVFAIFLENSSGWIYLPNAVKIFVHHTKQGRTSGERIFLHGRSWFENCHPENGHLVKKKFHDRCHDIPTPDFRRRESHFKFQFFFKKSLAIHDVDKSISSLTACNNRFRPNKYFLTSPMWLELS